jgi:hypothetical protein
LKNLQLECLSPSRAPLEKEVEILEEKKRKSLDGIILGAE